jgi:hypothetical protein
MLNNKCFNLFQLYLDVWELHTHGYIKNNSDQEWCFRLPDVAEDISVSNNLVRNLNLLTRQKHFFHFSFKLFVCSSSRERLIVLKQHVLAWVFWEFLHLNHILNPNHIWQFCFVYIYEQSIFPKSTKGKSHTIQKKSEKSEKRYKMGNSALQYIDIIKNYWFFSFVSLFEKKMTKFIFGMVMWNVIKMALLKIIDKLIFSSCIRNWCGAKTINWK